MKTFRYSTRGIRRGTRPSRTKPVLAKDQEILTGVLQGKKVPETEERWFKAVHKTGKARSYMVQMDLGVRGMPGYRQLDALVQTDFGWRAFEVDGAAFVHRGEAKQAQDKLNDIQRVEHLRRLGVSLRFGIEHVLDTNLQTQEEADKYARRIL